MKTIDLPSKVSTLRRVLFICHDYAEQLDRRVINFAEHLKTRGHSVEILSTTRQKTRIQNVLSSGVTLTGAPILEIKYNSAKWLSQGISPFSVKGLMNRYVLHRRQLGIFLERRAPAVRLVLLAIRRTVKGYASSLFKRPVVPLSEERQQLATLDLAEIKKRELHHEEKAHLRAIYSNNAAPLKLGEIRVEEFDPLPFTTLFEKHALNLQRPDVIIACDLPALPAAVALKAKWGATLLYDSHELYPFQKEFTHRQKLYLSQEEALALRAVDSTITVSERFAEFFKKTYGANASCVNNSPTFSPSSPSATISLRSQIPALSNLGIILYHGGFSPGRQLLELAEAFASAPPEGYALVYVGYGELKEALQALSKKSNRIHVMDSVPQEQLPNLLKEADLIVISYPALDENTEMAFPNKLGDAIELGVPVVGNQDMLTLNDICTTYNIGHCGKMDDVQSIAATLTQATAWLSSNKPMLKERFALAQEDLGWNRQAAKFEQVVEELLHAE